MNSLMSLTNVYMHDTTPHRDRELLVTHKVPHAPPGQCCTIPYPRTTVPIYHPHWFDCARIACK